MSSVHNKLKISFIKENNPYYENNQKYFDELLDLVINNKDTYSLSLNTTRKYLLTWINSILPSFVLEHNLNNKTKCYWIFNGITKAICCSNSQCNKELIRNVDSLLYGYSQHGLDIAFCNSRCAMKDQRVYQKCVNTNLKRRGVEWNSKDPNDRKKSNETLFKHAAENPNFWYDRQQKTKQTKIANGHDPNWNNHEKMIKTKEQKKKDDPQYQQKINSKTSMTSMKNYGVVWHTQADIVKQHAKETNLKNRGVEYIFQDPNFREQSIKTSQKLYGVDFPSQSKEFRLRVEQTNIKNYGYAYPIQNPEYRRLVQKRYKYDNFTFDSQPELAIYIWCKDHNIDFQYQPHVVFEYEFNGKNHIYEPDFLIKGKLIEIKGDQFFKDDGTMQNPWDHSQDALYEAKHQCMLRNMVEIWKSNDYKKYLMYIKSTYGKDYLRQFKTLT